MRKIALALIVVMLPTLSAAQQTNRAPTHLKKAVRPHTAIGNPCAQYGEGFARIAGSDTCIKIGGSVGAEAGGSSRRWWGKGGALFKFRGRPPAPACCWPMPRWYRPGSPC